MRTTSAHSTASTSRSSGGAPHRARASPALLLLAGAAWLGPAPVTAQGPAAEEGDAAEHDSRSRSIGRTDQGRLEHGVRLRETPHVVRMSGGTTFGTEELVGLIHRAAARVHEESPGPRLLVGDLSRRGGGRLRPHSSHRNGRDADLGFYLTDEDGEPTEPARFVELDHSACGRDRGTAYCIDGERTFRLIAAMLDDPITRVQLILVAPDLREQILAAGRRLDVSDDVLGGVRTVTEARGGSEAHRSHLHVRIYCPVDDRPRCRDTPPFHAWYEGEPPTARRARARRRRAIRRRRRAIRRRRARQRREQRRGR
ncbi:MAG TPA: penicillin-insensitive murein endopeptidase [Sandaracinaceae bacterium LLY-WYZ-13_1]|nr:penicillin-insensitive murein endopeptidase [Sandaracinaceae bacterium LLY-WYZ-13_1]